MYAFFLSLATFEFLCGQSSRNLAQDSQLPCRKRRSFEGGSFFSAQSLNLSDDSASVRPLFALAFPLARSLPLCDLIWGLTDDISGRVTDSFQAARLEKFLTKRSGRARAGLHIVRIHLASLPSARAQPRLASVRSVNRNSCRSDPCLEQ